MKRLSAQWLMPWFCIYTHLHSGQNDEKHHVYCCLPNEALEPMKCDTLCHRLATLSILMDSIGAGRLSSDVTQHADVRAGCFRHLIHAEVFTSGPPLSDSSRSCVLFGGALRKPTNTTCPCAGFHSIVMSREAQRPLHHCGSHTQLTVAQIPRMPLEPAPTRS